MLAIPTQLQWYETGHRSSYSLSKRCQPEGGLSTSVPPSVAMSPPRKWHRTVEEDHPGYFRSRIAGHGFPSFRKRSMSRRSSAVILNCLLFLTASPWTPASFTGFSSRKCSYTVRWSHPGNCSPVISTQVFPCFRKRATARRSTYEVLNTRLVSTSLFSKLSSR
jgi:hypothetical protein